ncbi:hypothetical protein DRN62_00330 [Nanoarchaeota archaeon]|nr:MAG: hypothetical protein DRN62_00330 [Nanoarchaeota archaeon]
MKAQGLPLNTIVLGALALLVLVLLAAAFVPSIGNMFRSMLGITGTGNETFIQQCQLACQNLDNKYTQSTFTTAAQGSSFCTSTYGGKHCYHVITCTAHTIDGKTVTVDSSCCGGSCTFT